MGLSYKKLWKLLIDRGMKKGELRQLAGISQSTMSKLAQDKNVTTEILARICVVLECSLDDIAEIKTQVNDNSKGKHI